MTEVTVHTEDKVNVPTGQRMMVSTTDWARIRSAVDRVGDPIVDWAAVWAGIAVGAVLALIGIAVSIDTSKDPHKELLVGLKVSIAFCILFAFFFGLVGLREHRRHAVTSHGICEDMDGIAEHLGHPGLGVLAPKPRIGISGHLKRIWSGDKAPVQQPSKPEL